MTLARPAKAADIPGIARLVESHARAGKILPRSLEAIQASIDDWVVVNGDASILACGSLLFYSPELAEVRSLAVDSQTERTGLGTAIVELLIEEARRRGVQTLFALTRAVQLFERLGFMRSEKDWFPEKIWRDCALCPVKDNCDEDTVVFHLGEKKPDLNGLSINNHGGNDAKTRNQ